MADERLQDLRCRAAQGEPAARAAMLAERLRLGQLTRERLELATYVGDADAARLTGAAPRDPDDAWRPLRSFGRVAVARAAVAAARRGDQLRRLHDSVGTLRVAEQWIVCPCERHRLEARRAHTASVDVWVKLLGHLCGDDTPDTLNAGLASIHQVEFLIGEDLVAEAVRDEVAAWALDERDAVRDRVEALDRGCIAILGESTKPGDPWPTPDFCGRPGTLWRGPTSTGPRCCCPEHEPTNPQWFRVTRT